LSEYLQASTERSFFCSKDVFAFLYAIIMASLSILGAAVPVFPNNTAITFLGCG
jgi:hypothetical protein